MIAEPPAMAVGVFLIYSPLNGYYFDWDSMNGRPIWVLNKYRAQRYVYRQDDVDDRLTHTLRQFPDAVAEEL